MEKLLKKVFVLIFGKRNATLLKANLLRLLKNMPRYTIYPEALDSSLDLIILGRRKSDVFFGYYDVTPFDPNGGRILCHFYDRDKKGHSQIELAYWDINSNKKVEMHTFAKTETWCWQMGARLQWLPSHSNNLVIFNTMVESAYGSTVMDLGSEKSLRRYSYPIYSLSKNGRKALYLNFSRLHRLRPGYGYRNLQDETEGKLAPDDDGLYMFELDSGRSFLLHSLKEIAKVQASYNYGKAEHYINHLLWNSSADKYLFFHLWQDGISRQSRLMVAGEDFPLRCVFWPRGGNVSHYAWRSDREILLTVSDEKKRLKYLLIDIFTGTKHVLGASILTSDGHPSFSPHNCSWILTDTYPDKFRNQLLFLYDMENRSQKKIAYFYSPAKFYGAYRCDLHPRFNHDGSKICVDSPHSGRRQMVVVPVEV